MANSRVYWALAVISSKNRGYMPTITPSVGLMFSKANLNASRTVSWLAHMRPAPRILKPRQGLLDLPHDVGHGLGSSR